MNVKTAQLSFAGFYAVAAYFFYRAMATPAAYFESSFNICHPDFCWLPELLYGGLESPFFLYFFLAFIGFVSCLLNMRFNSQILRGVSFLCLMATIYRGNHTMNSLAIGGLTLACVPYALMQNRKVLAFEIFTLSFMSCYYLSGIWKLWGLTGFLNLPDANILKWLLFEIEGRESWLRNLLVENTFLGATAFISAALLQLSSIAWIYYPRVLLPGVILLVCFHLFVQQVFVLIFRENVLILIFCFIVPLLISRREAN